MKITPAKLKLDFYRGIRALTDHPCSVCREGTTFQEFPHFHGSDFGKCPRSVQFEKIVNGANEHDDLTHSFLHDGHVHEAAIVAALRKQGYEITGREDADGDEFEVALNVHTGEIRTTVNENKLSPEEIRIIGHTDGKINNRYLLECKAVKDWAFENKFRRGKLPENYKAQMRCYEKCLDLESGFLFVKSRHTSEVLTFEVPRNDDFILERAKGFRVIVDSLGDLPSITWNTCTGDATEKRWCRTCKQLDK